MHENTLYTSIGQYLNNHDSQGNPCPTVVIGGRELLLDPQELLLWAMLNWRIVRREEIAELYDRQVMQEQIPQNRTLDACIDRLLIRGLLICGTGNTEYDALYDLLAAAYIHPIPYNPLRRIAAAIKYLTQIPLSSLPHLLRRDRRTDLEEAVMELSKQAMLSTAEIILCTHKEILKISSDTCVVSDIYADCDSTSDNIADKVKSYPCAQNVVVAIANLYLRRQLILDRS